MKLRELQEKDAEYMLEWMHDKNVCSYLGKDFMHMTIENCQSFIRTAAQDDKNRHWAIVDDNDEYMGTISLKQIDQVNKRAEYAISCRSKAMGKGFSRKATARLFEIARDEFHLELIYLNVYDFNQRAQGMYRAVGFEPVPKPDFIKEETDARLEWYQKKLA